MAERIRVARTGGKVEGWADVKLLSGAELRELFAESREDD